MLSELGLIALATRPLALSVPAPAGRTALERSLAYRAYAERLRDGLEFLAGPERVAAAPPAGRGRLTRAGPRAGHRLLSYAC